MVNAGSGRPFTALLICRWLAALTMETLFIEPDGPWENGSVESFNGKLRDEFLDCEML